MSITVYTIGHSTHTTDAFLRLLRTHEIATLVDVRSVPYSRYNPQYGRESLAASLRTAGLDYQYLGDSLGGRLPGELAVHDRYKGYALLSRTTEFQTGLTSLMAVAAKSPTAIMCAEKDPLGCHRTLLVSQALVRNRVHVEHILHDGQLQTHTRLMDRLLERYGLDNLADAGSLFQVPREERIELAISRQLVS